VSPVNDHTAAMGAYRRHVEHLRAVLAVLTAPDAYTERQEAEILTDAGRAEETWRKLRRQVGETPYRLRPTYGRLEGEEAALLRQIESAYRSTEDPDAEWDLTKWAPPADEEPASAPRAARRSAPRPGPVETVPAAATRSLVSPPPGRTMAGSRSAPAMLSATGRLLPGMSNARGTLAAAVADAESRQTARSWRAVLSAATSAGDHNAAALARVHLQALGVTA
jgi:hypothetical protein